MEDCEAMIYEINNARQFLNGCEMTHYLDSERIELFRRALNALMREIDKDKKDDY